jgi:hypothetical protein
VRRICAALPHAGHAVGRLARALGSNNVIDLTKPRRTTVYGHAMTTMRGYPMPGRILSILTGVVLLSTITAVPRAASLDAEPAGGVAVSPAQPSDDEIKADFALIGKINTVGAWYIFLSAHPTGPYADRARERIKTLGGLPP